MRVSGHKKNDAFWKFWDLIFCWQSLLYIQMEIDMDLSAFSGIVI